MPIQSDFTTEMGQELQLQLDAIGEELKSSLGWPPLGVTTLTPSGNRAREHKAAETLGSYLTTLGQQGAVEVLQTYGQQILDSQGEDVLREAVSIANNTFMAERGHDGREDMVV